MDININAIDKLFAWAESFNGKEIKNDEAILLMDFGHSTTSVYIASAVCSSFCILVSSEFIIPSVFTAAVLS